MMDDGATWYENLVFSPEKDLYAEYKENYTKQSLEQVYEHLKMKREELGNKTMDTEAKYEKTLLPKPKLLVSNN